jgi:Na+/H+-dicarboxylate symporter
MSAAAINVTALAKMLYSSLIAGISVALIFSIVILGAVRSSDMRRANRATAAAAYAVLASVGLALAIGVVVYGLILVAHKR